jgi:hypothetical protein
MGGHGCRTERTAPSLLGGGLPGVEDEAEAAPGDLTAEGTRLQRPRHHAPGPWNQPWPILWTPGAAPGSEMDFALEVLAWPLRRRLQLIAFVTEAMVAKLILDHLGLDSR